MGDKLHIEELPRLSALVAETMGLHFPQPRWPDLERGIAAAAKELGCADSTQCARRLLGGAPNKNELDVLACHLTVGETYFCRENRGFELLAEQILPKLIHQRRNRDQRLRIWSAACCTGEEAYSIAITLRRAIPDIDDWNLTLLATDINPRFLRKAAAGVFGRWSFRNVPAEFQGRYFTPVGEGQWEILPHIKKMVRFAPLNLVEDIYPALGNETNAMDVIFCRNVLMYFTPRQVRKVVAKLHRAQVDGGWLIVGSSDLSQISFWPYVAANSKGATQYVKTAIGSIAEIDVFPEATPVQPIADPQPVFVPRLEIDVPTPHPTQCLPEVQKSQDVSSQSLQDYARLRQTARLLANEGRLIEALNCCERSVAGDRLNPSGHYLRAVILQEQGMVDEAVRSLRGALYLDPGFVLAHFALGNIARGLGRRRDAEKHLENAKRLLSGYPSDKVLPESEGVTAGRFMEIVDQLREMEAVG
jgi:chemotaxis protein methyltransferase CheR